MKDTAPKSENLEVRSEKRDQESSFSLPSSHFSLHPPALVPKLRFPEFLGAKGWTGEKLGSKTKKVGSGITPTGGEKNYKQSGRPFVRSQNVGWGELLLNDVAFIDEETHNTFSSTQIAAFDVLLNITGASIGRSAVADDKIEGGNVNQHVCIIRVKSDELSPIFLNQYLISHDGQKQIDSFQAGGNRQGLNFEQIRSFLIPLPPSPAEQQKIAECLSSVDELMAAQAQKVDALKTHKKGLLQKLFPAVKGSGSKNLEVRNEKTEPDSSFSIQNSNFSIPPLRFPEFLNSGEWEEKKLLTLSSEPLSNGVFNDPKKVGSGYKLINVSDMYIDTTIDESRLTLLELLPSDFAANQVITGDIFFTRSSLVKSGIAVSNIYLGSSNDVTYDGHLIRFRPSISKVVPLFAHYLFKTEPIRAQLIARGKTATMTTIGQADVASVTLFYPDTAEQQRIADCLTTLDAVITAETQKHENLKTHKRGLMQQLFPPPEEIADL
jgi:type I restriction enzyme S subunit